MKRGVESRNENGLMPQKDVEQPKKRKMSHLFLMNLLWFSNSVITMASSIVVVPSQIRKLVGDSDKGKFMGILVSCCAITTLVISPVIGFLSDRCHSCLGKRHPFIIAGSVILMLCLLLQSFISPKIKEEPSSPISDKKCDVNHVQRRCHAYLRSKNMNNYSSIQSNISTPRKQRLNPQIIPYMLLNIIACGAQSSISVSYHGLLAEQVSSEYRGFVSGLMGSFALIGNMLGATSGLLLNFINIFWIYVILCGINSVCLIIVINICKEDVITKDSLPENSPSWQNLLYSFWKPLKDFNFRWIFFTRFLMQQGVATVTSFLEYWIDDMVLIPNCWSSEAGLTFLLLPMLLTSAIFSILGGYLSDKLKRRKVLVIISCFLMAICALALAFAPEKYRFYIGILASCTFGVGYGSYTSIDFALIIDVISHSKTMATDLAVWHQAMVLPSCIATPIGGLIVDGFQRINCTIGLGYILVYTVSASYFILAGLFILRLKRIK